MNISPTSQLRQQRKSKKNITLGEYIENWYKIYKLPKHAITTVSVQLNYINTHIKTSKIGKMNLSSIRTDDIETFINELLLTGNKCKLKHNKKAGKGLAKSTVKKIQALLISSFKQAYKDKLIPYNYANDLEPIKLDRISKTFFSTSQEKFFLEKSKNHKNHLAYKLLFKTGARRSEMLGLPWDYVNFQDSFIHIEQVLIIPQNQPIIKKFPKNSASIRNIPLHADLIKELKDLYKAQQKKKKINPSWNNDNLVFVNKDGTPINPKNFSQNFKKVIKRLGLNPNLHVHSTRHTFATNMLQLNIPFTDVQALGGWASSDVLLDIYAHSIQQSHRKAMNKLYNYS